MDNPIDNAYDVAITFLDQVEWFRFQNRLRHVDRS
ncbi:MAG: hypothetical protein AB199_03610 [Parcubacteria bacterium C7867-004]|nr:MAG: hypothetical protein AB199_03610 [Parcubacteria bacterium C7867-004]